MSRVAFTLIFFGLIFTNGTLVHDREFISSFYLGALVFLMGTLQLVRYPKRLSEFTINLPIMLLATAFIWLSFITIIRGPWYDSGFYLLRYFCLLALVIWIYQDSSISINFIRRLYVGIFTAICLFCAVCWFLDLKPAYTVINFNKEFSFTIQNRNHFTLFILPGFFLQLAVLFNRNISKKELIVSCLAAALGFVLIVAAESRNGLLQLILGSGIFFALVPFVNPDLSRRLYFKTVGAFAILAALWISISFSEVILTKLTAVGSHEADTGRYAIWLPVLGMITESAASLFFGNGAGYLYEHVFNYPTKELDFRINIHGYDYSHCELLDIVLEGGLFLLLLVVTVVLLIFKGLAKSLLGKYRDAGSKMELLALSCAFLVVIGFSLFSVATRYTIGMLPFAVLLGILLRILDFKKLSPSRPLSLIATIVLIAGCFLGTFTFSKRLLAEHYGFKSRLYGNIWSLLESNADQELPPHFVRFLSKEGFKNREDYDLRAFTQKAIDNLEAGLAVEPKHLNLRYKHHERTCNDLEGFQPEAVEAALLMLEELVPNYGNCRQNHALYLAKTKRLDAAKDLLREQCARDYYNLSMQIDLMIYEAVSGNRQSLLTEACNLFVKALEAEINQGSVTIKEVHVEEPSNVVVVFDDPQKKRYNKVVEINTSLFVADIFKVERVDNHHVVQRAIPLLCQLFEEYFGIEDPKFMQKFRVVETET